MECYWVPGENTSISVAGGTLEYKFSNILYLKQKKKKKNSIDSGMKLNNWQPNFSPPIYTWTGAKWCQHKLRACKKN